jgi:hypothetical protein
MAKPDLKSLLNTAESSRNKIRCVTCRLVAQLPSDDSEALVAALNSEMSSTVIADALTNYGSKLSSSAVSRHRRECQ